MGIKALLPPSSSTDFSSLNITEIIIIFNIYPHFDTAHPGTKWYFGVTQRHTRVYCISKVNLS